MTVTIDTTGNIVRIDEPTGTTTAVLACRRCFGRRSLGILSRPGKVIGLFCLKCWNQRRHSLEVGHGYRWESLAIELPGFPVATAATQGGVA